MFMMMMMMMSGKATVSSLCIVAVNNDFKAILCG
jgi:hypothetical protein